MDARSRGGDEREGVPWRESIGEREKKKRGREEEVRE
jgi:hypothetical protein